MYYNEALHATTAVDLAVSRLAWAHPTRQKSWDLHKAAHYIVHRVPDRLARILDVGCAHSVILEQLHGNGYGNLHGCDLSCASVPSFPGFSFWQGDLTRTPYPSGHFRVVTCLSVLEHGVPVQEFLSEMARILGIGGSLLLSTDYWSPKIDTSDVDPRTTFNLPWTIFSREEIERLVQAASLEGLHLIEPVRWGLQEPTVHWWGKSYTFIFLAFAKIHSH